MMQITKAISRHVPADNFVVCDMEHSPHAWAGSVTRSALQVGHIASYWQVEREIGRGAVLPVPTSDSDSGCTTQHMAF